MVFSFLFFSKAAVHSNRPRRFDLLLLNLTAIFEYNYLLLVNIKVCYLIR
jgi:hypothetical protein